MRSTSSALRERDLRPCTLMMVQKLHWNGQPRPASKLVRIAPDFTLMQPFGGPASHGFDASPQRLAEMSRYFRGGKTELEVAQTYSSGDLVVLVMIERQTGEVGGLQRLKRDPVGVQID